MTGPRHPRFLTRCGFRAAFALLAAPLIAGVTGCGSGGTTAPLDPNQFIRSGETVDARREPLTDRPGPIIYDNVGVDLLDSDPAGTARQAQQRQREPMTGVSQTVEQAIISPRAAATRDANLPGHNGASPAADTAPTTVPGVGVGTSLTLGAVVVEVDGEPIYAHRVVETLEPVLAAKARELDETRFRNLATKEIEDQVRVLIRDQIEFATARRNLDEQDRRIADILTQRWRDDLIRKSGGSLQLARQAAAAQGIDFERLVEEQHRLEMRRVYFQKKEMPKIQVSADDMRKYYQKHLVDMFTEHEQARFRIIKIDPAAAGGREQALAKAEEVRKRVASEDFAKVAAEVNDDAFLKRNAGDPTGNGTAIDRGAFANQKLEEAVWALQPGQVTPAIESGGAFYVAKLDEKKTGSVKAFEDPAVQSKIMEKLRAEQFNALRDSMTAQLVKNAIVYPDPPRFAAAIEIAMQRYPYWARKTDRPR